MSDGGNPPYEGYLQSWSDEEKPQEGETVSRGQLSQIEKEPIV